MSTPADSLILDLEARQEAALRQLIELEQRIEDVLREAQPAAAPRPTLSVDAQSETRPSALPFAA